MKALEAEEEITRSINVRIQDADTTLLTTLQERAERTSAHRVGSAAESPLVMKFADALIRKMGVE